MTIIKNIGDVVNEAGEAIGSGINSFVASLQNRKSVDIADYIPIGNFAYLFSPDLDRDLILDAVFNISSDVSCDVVQTPVESGAFISEHYRRNPRTVIFTGIISDTKVNKEDPLSVQEYVSGINSTIDSKEYFTLYTDAVNIPNLEKCLIQSFGLTRDQSTGIGLSVTITVQEVLIIDRAKPTTLSVSRTATTGVNAKDNKDKPEKDSGDKSTKQQDTSVLKQFIGNFKKWYSDF